jgi:predicted nucleotidyltransferase
MIAEEMRATVAAKLDAVAAEEGVRVLYAAESGSRAWGFASPDSDWDVRFIYAHERNWYVSLWESRDVIERPLDEHRVDLAGWDIRKALRLLLKSNPVLYEWLVSPIVYADGPLRAELKALFEAHASPRALAHHYWSIARGQWRAEIAGKAKVRLKKYFYIVRPLLSLTWVAERRSPPPMAIGDLLERCALPEGSRRAVEVLLAEKREAPERGLRPPIAEIDAWVAGELEQFHPDRLALPGEPLRDIREDADRLYRRVIGAEA